MVEDRIGLRYAKSIFELAQEKKVLEEVKADMDMIHTACKESREFSGFLKSPLIYATKKQAVLDLVFGKRYKSDFSKQLVEIIVRKGREMYLENVASSFIALYDEANKIVRGVLTTATALSKANRENIKKAIEAQTGASFEVEEKVNPELIGGFTLKIGDQLFDGSVANSIRRIKQSFQN